MYRETFKIGIGNRIVIGLMAIVLFIFGSFISLLFMAVVGALGLFALTKIWWAKRRAERACIDAEYHVVRE